MSEIATGTCQVLAEKFHAGRNRLPCWTYSADCPPNRRSCKTGWLRERDRGAAGVHAARLKRCRRAACSAGERQRGCRHSADAYRRDGDGNIEGRTSHHGFRFDNRAIRIEPCRVNDQGGRDSLIGTEGPAISVWPMEHESGFGDRHRYQYRSCNLAPASRNRRGSAELSHCPAGVDEYRLRACFDGDQSLGAASARRLTGKNRSAAGSDRQATGGCRAGALRRSDRRRGVERNSERHFQTLADRHVLNSKRTCGARHGCYREGLTHSLRSGAAAVGNGNCKSARRGSGWSAADANWCVFQAARYR